MKLHSWIKQLAKVCDAESSRYALGGVACKSDGVTAQLTATDGRILATVRYPEDGDGTEAEMDCIVDGKALASPPAAAFKALRPHLMPTYDGTSLTYGGTTTSPPLIDGRFPRYEDLFTIHDEPDGYTLVRLDPALLKKLCELAQAVQAEQTKGITLFIRDSKSCVFATCHNSETVARMAIMPLACDDENWKPQFPARTAGPCGEGTDSSPVCIENKAKQPAPPPEMLDDDAIAEAVTREPEPMIVRGVGIVACGPLAPIGC